MMKKYLFFSGVHIFKADNQVIEKMKELSKRLKIDYQNIKNIIEQEKNIYNNNDIVDTESNILKGLIERMFTHRIKSQEKMIRMNKATKERMETELKEIQEKDSKNKSN